MTCLHCDSKCLPQEPQPSSAEAQTTLEQNVCTDLEFSKEQWRPSITHVHRKKIAQNCVSAEDKGNCIKNSAFVKESLLV